MRVAEDELRDFLFGRLPQFVIPNQLLVVPEIPIGLTEKIQHIGLAERFSDRLTPAFASSRGETEAFLGGLFSEGLGIERAGRPTTSSRWR